MAYKLQLLPAHHCSITGEDTRKNWSCDYVAPYAVQQSTGLLAALVWVKLPT